VQSASHGAATGQFCLARSRNARKCRFPNRFRRQCSFPPSSRVAEIRSALAGRPSHVRWQRRDPPQHASKRTGVSDGSPLVTCVLDQPSAGFHQALLQAGQRPAVDPRRQHQPPPQIPEVVGDQAQPQPQPAKQPGCVRISKRSTVAAHIAAFAGPRGRAASRRSRAGHVSYAQQ
jgi:hypothetical protein